MNKNKSVIQAVKAHPIVIIFLAACILSPLLFQNTYFRYLLSEIFFYAAMGCAWNILGGFGRQISWCSASFVAIGAYTTSIFFVDYDNMAWYRSIGCVGHYNRPALLPAARHILLDCYHCFRNNSPPAVIEFPGFHRRCAGDIFQDNFSNQFLESDD